jgi:hypothetical protein
LLGGVGKVSASFNHVMLLTCQFMVRASEQWRSELGPC